MNFLPGFYTTLFYLNLMDWSLKTSNIKNCFYTFGNQNVQKLWHFMTLQKDLKTKTKKPDLRFSCLLGRSRRANKHFFGFSLIFSCHHHHLTTLHTIFIFMADNTHYRESLIIGSYSTLVLKAIEVCHALCSNISVLFSKRILPKCGHIRLPDP